MKEDFYEKNCFDFTILDGSFPTVESQFPNNLTLVGSPLTYFYLTKFSNNNQGSDLGPLSLLMQPLGQAFLQN